MYLHANAKLGLAGRLALVRAIEEGLSLKAAVQDEGGPQFLVAAQFALVALE